MPQTKIIKKDIRLFLFGSRSNHGIFEWILMEWKRVREIIKGDWDFWYREWKLK